MIIFDLHIFVKYKIRIIVSYLLISIFETVKKRLHDKLVIDAALPMDV